MCRAIKTLHNFKPPATEDEIRASSLQFVRKLSGFTRPSKANQIAFDRAVDETYELIGVGADYVKSRRRSVFTAEVHIRYLRELGATAVELLPVQEAQSRS